MMVHVLIFRLDDTFFAPRVFTSELEAFQYMSKSYEKAKVELEKENIVNQSSCGENFAYIQALHLNYYEWKIYPTFVR